MKTGIELITDERKRQIEKEGWTAEHDEVHKNGELANMAALYAITNKPLYKKPGYFNDTLFEVLYPEDWDMKWWKPTPDNKIKELVKAGALIAAEIDRLQTARQ